MRSFYLFLDNMGIERAEAKQVICRLRSANDLMNFKQKLL
jgi:hypothetical protein